MVTIIKNQLLKHLSRYTKNLSPEQISLSALRGSGELHDLTLEENLLTELLELPGWLRLTSAKCNRASFRIQWTKLKTVPIVLLTIYTEGFFIWHIIDHEKHWWRASSSSEYHVADVVLSMSQNGLLTARIPRAVRRRRRNKNLDEVHIALEVCPEPRPMNPDASSAVPVPGKYSYIHKVIDGISVAVNQVQIDFACDAFTSSVQISRVTVESRTPDGLKGDLRLTRIKSPDTGQLLIFKELEWQSARVEARPRAPVDAALPPLRLLLGNALCRIVIKKRLSDCAVLGSRLVLRPEAVAWALTDGQLRAAVSCATALAEPVKKATEQAKRQKAGRKVEEVHAPEPPPSRGSSSERDILARMFAKHDVRETSYHLLAPRIDLHLCDDPGLGRSVKPSLIGGGAIQVSIVNMQADFFPYHRASADRRHWRGYREAATPHTQWLSQALNQFCSSVLEALDSRQDTTANKTPEQSPSTVPNGVNHSGAASPSNSTTSQASSTRSRILQQLNKLMTTCLVLRIDDFTVYKVSTGKSRAETPRPLLSGERSPLPGDAGLLHAELTFFYTPGDIACPVPPPKLYAQLSPVRISVDPDSVVWLAAFLRHVAMAVATGGPKGGDTPFYMDVRCEAIMPKIVLEAGAEHVSQQRDRPKELHICTARANITNVRESGRAAGAGTRGELASLLANWRRAGPPPGTFPTEDGDRDPVDEQFVLHADKLDDIERGPEIRAEMLWRERLSIWCIRVEPLWAELCGARASPRPAALLDATPLTAWVCLTEDLSRINVLARTTGLCGLQLNHYQLLFLLRQLEKVSDTAAWLAADQARDQSGVESAIVVGLVVPAVELTLVLPSNCAGQESSRDLDSVPLDSSSLQDYKLGSEATMAPSNLDRDSVNATIMSQPGAITFAPPPPQNYTQQPPLEEVPPPSPGSVLNFSGLSSMRRGLASLVTSLDGALRDESRSDAASTASSDSDRYVILGLAADCGNAHTAFREFEEGAFCATGVEMAAEVVERSSTGSGHSRTSSITRRRDLISTCTWRLNNVNIVNESASGTSSIRLVADDLTVDECSAIPWDEFQNKFSLRARAFMEPVVGEEDEFKPREPPRVAARLVRKELPRNVDENGEPIGLPSHEELLEARVKDLSLSLNMSTALALAEFIEDEVIQPPMPLEALIENLKIHLEEDRPTRSISSPPPQPLDLDLTTLRLTRDTEGIVRIGPPLNTPSTIASPATPQSLPELEEAKEKIERLNKENEELKKRLSTLARIAEDNRELRAKAEEAGLLRACAHSAQQEAAALLRDKTQLLDALHALQEQLGYRGKR